VAKQRQKVRGNPLAVGYWGNDPHCRILQEETAAKIKALLQDKLIAMGRPVELWLPVTAATPGVVACTCDKNTRPGSDYKCLSCYGMRFVPGYLRFLHETIFFSSAEAGSFTLTNCEVDTSIKPNRIRLTSTAVTGTVVTTDKPFDNAVKETWDQQVAVFRKTATDTIVVEFSTDGGVTYTDISLLNGPKQPTGTGLIRFRVTLTRVALTTDSPDFEVLRIRRRLPEFMTDASQTRTSDQLIAGQIWILRTWVVEQTLRQVGVARQTEFQNDKSWTAPLDFYDNRVVVDTPPAKIDDRDAGPHPFYEHATGIDQGTRFPIYQMSYNEQLGTFTHQAFAERKAQNGELYGVVF
jgi:hypothetical protein